jgi:hypothetical protein
MKAIMLDCSCGAKSGEQCCDTGYGAERMSKTGFHVSRIRRARMQTTAENREKRAADVAAREAIAAVRSKP